MRAVAVLSLPTKTFGVRFEAVWTVLDLTPLLPREENVAGITRPVWEDKTIHKYTRVKFKCGWVIDTMTTTYVGSTPVS